ncbi:MAG: epoxyqueuosine reductase QueH [Actinomycetota bacterium]|nr:epoxyqueuosine reductase QueH [Actinomycetota bacterium]
MRVLSHVCCGPCFTAVHENLSQSGYDLAAYYYNPNIHPVEEYRLRLSHLERFCGRYSVPLIAGDYEVREYFAAVDGHEDKPDRCIRCYTLRLERTAELAAQDDYDAFTTSLLLSPYQYHDELRAVADKLSGEHDIEFLYRDFRPAYRRSIELSKSLDMYRQKYCGCAFSEKER